MKLQAKLNVLALMVFLTPLIIVLFTHDLIMIKRWVNLAFAFACPLAVLILTLGRKRNSAYYAGIATLLVPFEMTFIMSYRASFVVLTKQQIAIYYLTPFFFATLVALPLGLALTYKGTRPTSS